jgi:hypothetical protein
MIAWMFALHHRQPPQTGDIVTAALHLTHFEYKYLR